MSDWLRRLRGAIGLGISWAVGWAPIGAVVGVVLGVTVGAPIGLGGVVLVNTTVFAILGFAGGALFSTALRLSEGRRSFEELSMPRLTGLGAAGGLVLGGLVVGSGLWGVATAPLVAAAVVGVSTTLGAGSAAGTLAIARQADDVLRVQSGSGRAAPSGTLPGRRR